MKKFGEFVIGGGWVFDAGVGGLLKFGGERFEVW